MEPIGSATGAPAVLVSMSIFFRIVQFLFHQEALTLPAPTRKKSATSKLARREGRRRKFEYIFIGPVKGLEICPESNGYLRIECIRLNEIEQRHTGIEGTIEMVKETNAGADSDTGQSKTRCLPRKCIANSQNTAIGKKINAAIVPFRLIPGDQLRCPQFDRSKNTVVSDRFCFEVTAHGGQAAAGKLFAVDQRLVGNLAL